MSATALLPERRLPLIGRRRKLLSYVGVSLDFRCTQALGLATGHSGGLKSVALCAVTGALVNGLPLNTAFVRRFRTVTTGANVRPDVLGYLRMIDDHAAIEDDGVTAQQPRREEDTFNIFFSCYHKVILSRRQLSMVLRTSRMNCQKTNIEATPLRASPNKLHQRKNNSHLYRLRQHSGEKTYFPHVSQSSENYCRRPN